MPKPTHIDKVYDLTSLNKIAKLFFLLSTKKGFHSAAMDAMGFGRYISNLHGEVSELWEAFRHESLSKPCDKAKEMEAAGVPVLTCAEEEIADIFIRLLELAHILKIDVAYAVSAKHAFNQTRPERHGGKVA
jgi:NTP pyrophosphatase (non-canonical NTP hydrolase)